MTLPLRLDAPMDAHEARFAIANVSLHLSALFNQVRPPGGPGEGRAGRGRGILFRLGIGGRVSD